MEINSRFDYDKLSSDQDRDVHLLVSLQAPKLDLEKRVPLAIIPALDISGSMLGRPLEYAKQSIAKLIDNLGPTDYCGLVVFSTEAQLISSPKLMTADNKSQLKNQLRKIESRGNTAFGSGMLMALQQLAKLDIADSMLARVIMFTDGHANSGPRSLDELISLFQENLGKASISCFAYGDNCNQELLNLLAQEAKGNYAFIKNPDDAPAAFAKELGGLLSVYAHDIKVILEPQDKIKITQVISDVTNSVTDKSYELLVPEILSEEVRHLVIKCKIATNNARGIEDLIKVRVKFNMLHPVQNLTFKSMARLNFVDKDQHPELPVKEVDDQVTLAQMIRAQIDAEVFAKAGNYAQAISTMDCFVTLADGKGQAKFGNVATKTSKRLSSSVAYADSRSTLESLKRVGTRGVGVSYSAELDSDIKGISDSLQFNNSVQDDLQKAFKIS